MTSKTYSLSLPQGFIKHFPSLTRYVRDGDGSENDLDLIARVRSGDYFMTFATELDACAQSLARNCGDEAADLERLVAELLQVNEHFKIVRKQL